MAAASPFFGADSGKRYGIVTPLMTTGPSV